MNKTADRKREYAYCFVVLFYVFVLEVFFKSRKGTEFLLRIAEKNFWYQYLDTVFYGLFAILFLIVCMPRIRIWIRDFWERRRIILRDIVIAYVITLLLIAITGLLLVYMGLKEGPVKEAVNLAAQREGMLEVLTVVLIGPFAEEMVFRGFLYDKIRGRLNTAKKLPIVIWVIIVSLIFMLYHCEIADFSDIRIVLGYSPIFVEGLMMTALYEKDRNLIASLLLHIGINLLAIIS